MSATQTGETPSRREIMDEIGASRATVARHISALKKSGAYPES
ncbi:winged helix-turn-helix transcriptional regulator [Corynebacterium striatum]